MINNYKEAKEILLDQMEYQDNINSTVPIEDLISKLADFNVDIYTSDLYKWAGTNIGYEYTNRAIEEFGWEGVGEELNKAYMMGQYIRNRELLSEAWEEVEKEI